MGDTTLRHPKVWDLADRVLVTFLRLLWPFF